MRRPVRGDRVRDPLWQFWTNWAVQALVAVGTGGAVYAALFGDSFKARRVRLSALIENPRGVYTPTQERVASTSFFGRQSYDGEARYYQLRVRNASKRFPAHRVDVWLLRVDRYGDGEPVSIWSGEIPLIWQHQGYIPGPRTIGHPANADIFGIFRSSGNRPVLALQPQIPALNLPAKYEGACKLRLALEVRSDEAVLDDLGVWVEWDGEWPRDDDDMELHVRFELA
jgi:hypothetical protein